MVKPLQEGGRLGGRAGHGELNGAEPLDALSVPFQVFFFGMKGAELLEQVEGILELLSHRSFAFLD